MCIPEPSSHYYFVWGTDSSPRLRHKLINNHITYEIVLMVALVSLVMLMPFIVYCCLRPCIAPDDYYTEEEEDNEQQEALPWNRTLTADGTLLDNEPGERSLKYGTSKVDSGHWYNADGIEMTYSKWIETVYDPLD